MRLEGYRLLAQVGVGQDGIAYQAEATGGDRVLVCVLAAARADGVRWPELARRLRRAALLQHPAAVGVRQLLLEHDPPCVVVDAAGPATLDGQLRGQVPVPTEQALGLCRPLAQVLAEAHRLGLMHGGVRPQTVLLTGANRPRLDFTALNAGGPQGGAKLAAQDPGEDSEALSYVLSWLLTGREEGPIPESVDRGLANLLRDLRADSGERLAMREAAARLDALLAPLEPTLAAEPALRAAGPAASDSALIGRQLGRFRLEEMLGRGGIGVVYRAVDTSDGRVVALKVLRGAAATDAAALRRFHKEARLLAEVQNPYVANLLEVNEDAGLPYLVLELVAGRSLGRVLAERGRLPECEALAILADVARGLAEAHARGIVHRDVKPENILLQDSQGGSEKASSPWTGRVKPADFGLARHVIETESLNLTQAGAILGTLLYMSPEQCAGWEIDARADVYSLGATLFHLVAGRPPFVADRVLALIDQHTKEPPPPLRRFNPEVSDGLCQMVARALAKAPDARYADAGALLEDLERLLRSEPTGMTVHPRRPACDPGRVLRYEWSWDLESPPERLWPYVSNTERLNRAAGLTPVEFHQEVEADDKVTSGAGLRGRRVRRFGSFRKAGIAVAWQEHPFEWIEARRMGVLREYAEGPFAWLMSVTELEPRGCGTRLVHRVELEPRGLLGRTLAAVEVGVRGRRSVERIYHRIDATLKTAAAGLVDAFEELAAPTRAQRQRLDRLVSELVHTGVVPEVAERLVDWVAHAPPQEVGRIRPLALARRLGLDGDAVVAACLHGARAGLLILLWDLICPLCRVSAAVKDTLRLLEAHQHCPACAEEFPLDFGSSVEMIFRAHPEVRTSELGTYCVGGPAHSPHVVAQARVAPGERMELGLALGPGAYRLRGPQLAYRLDFRVEPDAGPRRWDLELTRPPGPDFPRVLRAGAQVLVLSNDHGGELVIRVERVATRADALTAARASALALFRDLFPGEVLSPGQMVRVAAVTLLVTELEEPHRLYAEAGDAGAFTVLHELFGRLGDRVRGGGGAVVKTVAEGIMASFTDAEAAVRVGLDFQDVVGAGQTTQGLRLRIGIHRGPALAATVNDQLDYFGTAVRQALALPAAARGGGLVLTEAVAGDPAVAAVPQAAARPQTLVEAELPGAGVVPLLHLGLG
jgi:serine/threonine protein kinase/class 3 adenylate cyclase